MIYQSEKYPAQISVLHGGSILEFKFWGHLSWIEEFTNQNADEIEQILINPIEWLDTYVDQSLADKYRNRPISAFHRSLSVNSDNPENHDYSTFYCTLSVNYHKREKNVVRSQINIADLQTGMTVAIGEEFITVNVKDHVSYSDWHGWSFQGDASKKYLTRVRFAVPTAFGTVLR